MNQHEKDLGTITVLIKRFETERLPLAKSIKAKVDKGGMLDDQDLTFLQQVFDEARNIMPMISRNPEYASLAKGILMMYEEIMTKSQENSK